MPRTPRTEAAPTTARCERCDGKLVEISISLDPAGSMTMHSCSTCDVRYWRRDGRSTNLPGVLHTMATDGIPRTRRQVAARRAAG